MKKNINRFILMLFFLTTSSCGYKVLNTTEIANLNIKEFNTYGNKRINFKIKNNLMLKSSKDKKNNLTITLNTKKSKEIKEKNIENEITKYKISITSEVILNFIEINRQQKFSINATGDFLVGDKYSETLTNEKRLVEDLTDDISDQIKKKMFIIFDDF